MEQVWGISSHAAAALRSINPPSNICWFRDLNTVGSVFPTHLRWPVSAVQTSSWPWPTFRLWPTKWCRKEAGAGVSAAEVVSFVEPTPPLPSVSLLWLMSFPSGWPPASIKKESLSIPLAFTSTRLFLQNTHENTHSPDSTAASPILVKSPTASSLLKHWLVFYSEIMTQT